MAVPRPNVNRQALIRKSIISPNLQRRRGVADSVLPFIQNRLRNIGRTITPDQVPDLGQTPERTLPVIRIRPDDIRPIPRPQQPIIRVNPNTGFRPLPSPQNLPIILRGDAAEQGLSDRGVVLQQLLEERLNPQFSARQEVAKRLAMQNALSMLMQRLGGLF